MKKLSIVFLSLLLVIGSIIASPFTTDAAGDYKRISGTTRLDTAIGVSKEGWPNGLTSSEKAVVLARADNPADALAAASLAGVKDASILLTYPTKLDKSVEDELKRLGTKKVYLMGGAAAISTKIENSLKSKGYNVQRVAGNNRFETASKINQVAGTSKGTKAILANGYTVADALSASAASSINQTPIYLTEKDQLSIKLPSTIKQVDIYGGAGVISGNVETQLKAKGIRVNRISGVNRYATSVAAAKNLNTNSNNIILVRGVSVSSSKQDYPDAVAASGLAKKLNAKILLVHPETAATETKNYLKDKTLNTFVLGGVNAVSDNALRGLGYDTPGKLSVHFINVGQGDSIFIKMPNGKTVLVDGGKRAVGDVVVNHLKSQGVKKIDVMVATHPDADHIGGLIDVLNEFPVGKVLDSGKSHTSETYLDYLSLIDQKNIPFSIAKEGNSIELDSTVNVKVLNSGSNSSDNNDASIVLMVSHDEIDYLLTGDAGVNVEDRLIQKYDLDAEVLKVGHHGSYTSTSQAFVEAVNPTFGILSYGKGNQYGHPHSEVYNRLVNHGVDLISTVNGTIEMSDDGGYIYIGQQPTNPNPEPTPEPVANVSLTGVNLETEIVTVKNKGTGDITMAGWRLVSVEGNQTYHFPDNFILKAGKTVNITSGANAVNNPPTYLKWTGAYIWNNSGDKARLYNSQGELVSEY
ncbi:cell wall-binding repeat-containing protein [Rossellomorea vietnamensis]|uniref:Cell wall-binding repeat-containing protein n=1 Tax=Rossellomorea vietnamensis TaxID=218284 RepID=A0ACD4C7J6_9BACI|nr:cell wall-binding repeat-containing protein [Rossellomorea vietnamensis]UXH44468.1 cell wall-binding repeat-containing protein [Rossellomorea vietnamensis]